MMVSLTVVYQEGSTSSCLATGPLSIILSENFGTNYIYNNNYHCSRKSVDTADLRIPKFMFPFLSGFSLALTFNVSVVFLLILLLYFLRFQLSRLQ